MNSKPECFVCAGQPLDRSVETLSHWLMPRTLCLRHKQTCTLPGGELVDDFLRRWGHPFQLEGSGLSFFINPVSVEGCKGWCDFVAGGMVVCEELFSSHSWFDFWSQHNPSHLDLLYTLHLHRADTGGPVYAVLKNGYASSLYTMLAMWESQQQITRTLHSHGKTSISSPDEILELWHHLKPGWAEPEPESKQAFLKAVLDLAARRFAHLKS